MKEIRFENKYLYLSFTVGILYYLANYLKFPNSYGLAVSFTLLVLLIKNFKKLEGLKVIIYSLVISLLTLALSLAGSATMASGMIILSLNIILTLLMIFGLRGLKKWGLYLSITITLLGLVSILGNIIIYDVQAFKWTLPNLIFNFKIMAASAFSIVSLMFLIKFRKNFSSKSKGRK